MDKSIAFAFFLVSQGDLLTGVFALPMKFIHWKWENIWLSLSFFGFVPSGTSPVPASATMVLIGDRFGPGSF